MTYKVKPISEFKNAKLIDSFYYYDLYLINAKKGKEWQNFRIVSNLQSAPLKAMNLGYNGERLAKSKESYNFENYHPWLFEAFMPTIKKEHKLISKVKIEKTNKIPDNNLYIKLKETFDFDSHARESTLSTRDILKAIGYKNPNEHHSAKCNIVLKTLFDMNQRKTRGNLVYDMPPLKKN